MSYINDFQYENIIEDDNDTFMEYQRIRNINDLNY
jgi:hypothetical protein